MKLGTNQAGMIWAMNDHNGWNPNARPGWIWNTPGGTQKIVDSLVKRGLVEYDNDLGRYMLTETGKSEVRR